VRQRYVEVIIDSAVRDLDRPFTYSVPEDAGEDVGIGSMVLVPFSGRLALGYVVGLPSTSEYDGIKSIARVLDEPPLFDFDSQRLCRWIAGHYLCPLSQAFKLVMPPGRGRKVKQFVYLTGSGNTLCAGSALGEAILAALGEAGGEMSLDALKKKFGAGDAAAEVDTKGLQTGEIPVFTTAYQYDPEGQFFAAIVDGGILAAIERLPDDFRDTVILSDLEGLAYAEIAELLDIPVGTVKSRLFRGRRLLQQVLYEYATDTGYVHTNPQ